VTRRRLARAAALAFGARSAVSATAETTHPPLGPRVEVEGLRLHLLDRGEGPPVALLHGLNQNLRDFAFSMTGRLAARGLRAIALDRPGHGWSERPPGEAAASPFLQARLLRAALRRVGVERAILLGHSWGAACALAWALEAPESVAGLVLVSGASHPYRLDDAPAQLRLFLLARHRWLDGPIAWGLRLWVDEHEPETLIRAMFQPDRPPRGYADHVGVPLALSTRAVRANAQDLAALPRWLEAMAPRYASLDLPAEALHGEADPVMALGAQSAPLAEALPQARLTRLPGVGHMAHHAAEDAVVAAVERLAARA
jgi:pimeloyl-ACP methyl ester carboxylesterase